MHRIFLQILAKIIYFWMYIKCHKNKWYRSMKCVLINSRYWWNHTKYLFQWDEKEKILTFTNLQKFKNTLLKNQWMNTSCQAYSMQQKQLKEICIFLSTPTVRKSKALKWITYSNLSRKRTDWHKINRRKKIKVITE